MTDDGELVQFIATHVRQSGGGPPVIDGLRLLERTDDGFEDRDVVDRDEIITMLEDDERIFTWDHDADGLGREIFVEYVDVGETFLRVDEQEIEADDLGDLPHID